MAEARPAPRVESQPSGGRIEIVLEGGRQIHVAPPVDQRALADVVAVLEGADRRGVLHALEARAC